MIPWAEMVEARVLLSEFRVNTYTTDAQTANSIAMDAEGDFVVTWTSFGQEAGYDVYAQRFNAAGTPQGPEFRVNDYTAAAQIASAVAMDPAGNFVIVWNSFNQSDASSGWDVYGKRYDAAGNAFAGEFPINNYTAGNQFTSSVAMDADGDFVVTWDSSGQDGSGLGIYARAYDGIGVPRSFNFRVNDFTAGDQSRPRVAMDADGDFVIAWQSNGQDGSGDGVYARRYKLETGSQGLSFRVNTATLGAQNYPSVGMSTGGDFVIAWESDGQDGSGYGVYAQRYSAAGATQGSEFRVNTYTNANQAVPLVAMDSDGDFAIAWQSFGQDGSAYGMYAKRYNPAGVVQGSEFRVNSTTAADQWYGAIAMDSDGDFAVAWTSIGQDGSGDGVYADRFTSVSTRNAGPLVTSINAGLAREEVRPGKVLTRSDLNQVVVTFSENLTSSVTSLANWSLTRDGNLVVDAISGITFGFNANSNTYQAVLDLSNPLAKGSYILRAQPTILDTDGNALDGDQNGVAGGVFAFNFSVDPITVGPEFRVSADPDAQQTEPGVRPVGTSVAQDAEGNFVVVWAADGADGSGYGVRARRYNAAGVPLGAEFTVNTYTNGDQGGGEVTNNINTTFDSGSPSVAMNASGAFVITWSSYGQDGSLFGVHAQRFNPDGSPAGGEFRVNGTTAGHQICAAVSMNDAGQFIITWQNQNTSDGTYDVYARLYNADGTRAGSEFRVNIYQYAWQNVPSVAMQADGGFVVVWNSFTQDGSDNGVYLRRYGPAGPLTGDVRVNSTTSGDQYNFRYAIGMDAIGNYVVAWTSNGQDGSSTGIYAQRYNAAGQRLGTEFQVNTQIFDWQDSACVAMAPNGDFLITWTGSRQDGSGNGIFAQRYNAAGVPQGGEFRVNASVARNQDRSAAVMSSDGRFLVTWLSSHDFATGLPRGVFAQRFVIPGASPDILVSPASGLVTTETGGQASFTVRLNTQPAANVTIDLSSSNALEGTPNVFRLTFTPTNWNLPQTVVLTGLDDEVDDGDRSYSIITAPAVSTDPNYNGRNAVDVAASNVDDDTAGIVVTPINGLVTSEAGGAATFSIRLESQPTAIVTIDLTSSNPNEGSLSVGSVTFTPLNWSTTQTVTVTGIDDATNDGNVAYTITTAPAVSFDPNYNNRNAPDVSLTNVDNDSPGITVSSANGLVTTEAGGTVTFAIRLNTQPTANVTIPVSSSNVAEGTVSASSITFTSANWNTAQVVTVTGVDDLVDDGDVAYTIVLGLAISSDPGYSGRNPADLAVVNADDDTAAIVVTPISGLVTTEAGGTESFLIRLASQPTANVIIGLTSSDLSEGTISTSSVTFTPANWNVSQTVTLTGVDDAVGDGAIAYSIVTAPASSADAKYNGLNGPDVVVSNLDDDSVGITITEASGLFTTESGTQVTFTVRLNSQPTAIVTISVSSSNVGEGVVDTGSLTFTAANWNVPQTVTVTGVDDAFDDGDINYLVILDASVSSDPGYDGIDLQDLSLVNQDDDTKGITVTPTTGLVTTEAGGSASFTVRLDSRPTSTVTVGLSTSNVNEGSLSLSGLTFTQANWNVPQTVTVTGVDDAFDDGDISYLILIAPAVSADPIYDGVDALDASLVNQDNDTRGITVTPTTGLATTELGGLASFTVRLNSRPTSTVSIGLSSSKPGEGSLGVNTVVFTQANWNLPQTVFVTGLDDLVDDGDVDYTIVTAPAASTDPNYDQLDAWDVALRNLDDDTAGITVTPTSGLITSEASGIASFSVRLNSQPMADVTIQLSSDNVGEGTIGVSSLTFTPANWNTPQVVTVTGVDDAVNDGDVNFTIVSNPAVSADPRYNALDPSNVAVRNVDDDTAGITLTPTNGLITTEDGGTATFSIRLNSQPTGDVTIVLTSTNVGEGVPSTGSLTFTTTNWSVPQTVTVTGINDSVVDGTIAYSVLTSPASSTDPRYNGAKGADIALVNRDNDVTPPVTVSSARVVRRRVGRRTLMTVAITFSGDVDGATARTLANYSISAAGRDRRFGTRDDVVTRLTTVAYDPGTRTAILTPRNSTISLNPRPQLRIRSGGLLDSLRRPLDGNRDGSPGGDWVSILS